MRFTITSSIRLLTGIVFLASFFLGWIQSKQTKSLLPEHTIEKSSWKHADIRFIPARDGWRQPTFLMMGSENFPETNRVPRLVCELPAKPYGFRLNIRTHDADAEAPPTLQLSVNGTRFAEYQAPHRYFDLPESVDLHEVDIPKSLLSPSQKNTLEIQCMDGKAWKGSLLLIPRGSWRIPISYLLPISGWLFLFSFLGAEERGRRLYPWVLFLVLFFLYHNTLFTDKLDPLNHPFFKDSKDIMQAVFENHFHFYMMKHPLFLTTTHLLWKLMSLTTSDPWRALSLVLSLYGALNGLLAFVVLKRVARDHAAALLFSLIYAFSFSIWAFSAVCETYIFTSILVNAFLLVMLKLDFQRTRSLFWASALVVACGLAHPPMLILFGLVLIRWVSVHARWRRRALAMAAGLVVIGGYLLGQSLFHFHYEGVDPFRRTPKGDVRTDATPSAQLEMTQNIIKHYSQKEKATFTYRNSGNLLLGQFGYAFAGQPWPFDWSQGWKGLGSYTRSVPGAICLVLMAIFYIGAFRSCFTQRSFGKASLLVFLLVLLPYLLFFWFFNAREMIIHASPMMLPILMWLCVGTSCFPRTYQRGLYIAFALALMIHNTVVLATYH